MRLILLLIFTSLIALIGAIAATYSTDRIRISDLETKVSQLHLEQVSQQDINQYQMALNSNQTDINAKLREQIEALELRLKKLEKRKQ